MNYICLKSNTIEEPPYVITAIRYEDIHPIKQWRNDQIAILRQNVVLTDTDQENYWKHEIEPSFQQGQPKQILFSYIHAGKCIGYGGLTHINWYSGNAEVSFLVQTERGKHSQVYKKDFFHFLTLLKKAAFEDLKLHRIYAETYDVRPDHIAVLEKFGFRQEGRLKQHVKVDGLHVDAIIHGLLRS